MKWTNEEIGILKNNYEALSHEDLLVLLKNRTYVAIKHKASRLKLWSWGTIEERFWKYVDKGLSPDCWIWTGAHLKGGYGRIRINEKIILAHRFSYEIHNGKIPNKMCVCHICDNPKCVNPSHLFLGTQKDNVDDMVNKNRQFSKLTLNQVKEIKKLCCEGKLKQREIAKTFNISRGTISDIYSNKSWRHMI